jgi:hypothetical protein
MAKKYLDETGLQTLWSKVKSQDTDTLSSAKTYADTIVKNGTISFYQNGVLKGSFSVNQSTNASLYFTDNNTTYSNATTTNAGLMSAADKTKLDSMSSSGGGATKTEVGFYYRNRTNLSTENLIAIIHQDESEDDEGDTLYVLESCNWSSSTEYGTSSCVIAIIYNKNGSAYTGNYDYFKAIYLK